MSHFSPINPSGASRLEPLARPVRTGRVQVETDHPQRADRVEVSEEALRLSEGNRFRPELVQRVRAELDAGTYDFDARLPVAVDRLIDDIDQIAPDHD